MASRISSYEQKFMKMITSEVGEDLKLHIPPDFLEQNGIKLSSHILLTVPNNVVWEMRFIEEKKQIWLHKEFIQFYSIQYGHLLMFEYNGNSDFSLVIFDMTASEINYPSSSPKTVVVSLFSDEEELSVEILGVNGEKTKTVMERAKSFKTNNPVIVVTINSTNVASKVFIPKEFANKNLIGRDGKVIKEVTLEIVGSTRGTRQNKQWKVKSYFNFRDRNYKKKIRSCIFWRTFVEDNHVKFGDVCVLEYLKNLNVFVVHIFSEPL